MEKLNRSGVETLPYHALFEASKASVISSPTMTLAQLFSVEASDDVNYFSRTSETCKILHSALLMTMSKALCANEVDWPFEVFHLQLCNSLVDPDDLGITVQVYGVPQDKYHSVEV